jgi:hypothetical protein
MWDHACPTFLGAVFGNANNFKQSGQHITQKWRHSLRQEWE